MTHGQYPVNNLLKEPQAQVASRPGAEAPTTSANVATPQTPASAGQPLLPGAATPGVDPATHSIVRHQLEALADQSIHWRGEVWPGAEMDWHVRRHNEQTYKSSPTEDDEDPAWQSRIRLQLPELGDVTAAIQLSGKRVSLTIQASDTTTPILRQHAGELHRQMSDQQLELIALTLIDPDSSKS